MPEQYKHQEAIEDLTTRIEGIQMYLADLMIQRDTLMDDAGLEIPEYIFKDPPEPFSA